MKLSLFPPSNPREGLHWVKIWRFLALPFSPEALRTYLAVRRFEHIPVDRLIEDGIQGVLVDADGTLGPHHATEFPESARHHLQKMIQAGLRVAVYTNADEARFDGFEGVSVVTDVPPKPDVRGFEIAMEKYLELENPAAVCMIGDNYITDGGAIDAGMRFIHVRPVPGGENPFHRLTRFIAYLLARLYTPQSFRRMPR
ncbi:MAG: HAD hydrolase-like protein [Nitrospinaceae bacterium]|nr:HAD hydrolase-like protein [Nitrospinaceae bacterium]NIR57404.1 HAD hydrolase-like protein [Nitrospinaceae bacterium]NIS87856.1 HAD hydrolase-like protein [Nitrospinaceae bacterium]NIT84727.1 HAD hydrolase-like protein [Nitrospinaceae bacterium]NIU46905.1 HAD hydrolase-like protein [Nitrospinaceae bacterium]